MSAENRSLIPTGRNSIQMSDVVSALSTALDLTEGQPMGHSVRSCILGMRIAEELRLPLGLRSDLYYALLLKDSGCSANSARMHQILGSDERKAKREIKYEDWSRRTISGLKYLLRNVMPQAPMAERVLRVAKLSIEFEKNIYELISSRCERGAEIARKIGLDEDVASAIRSLDEHWNGRGYPQGLRGEEIPLLARIMNLSQTLEVFASLAGPRVAVKVICDRSQSWFDPYIVRLVKHLEHDDALWNNVRAPDARKFVVQMEPGVALPASQERIESLCMAFAQVIDAKSPYTFQHSLKVATASTAIAEKLGMTADMVTTVRRAALLHDIGKLSVSNTILEKPSELTVLEWDAIRMAPIYTRMILGSIIGLADLAHFASAHNERLDGSGYPDRLWGSEIPLPSRIIAVADSFQAMCEKRPYRDRWATETVLEMMRTLVPDKLDADCYEALKQYVFETSHGKHHIQSAGRI